MSSEVNNLLTHIEEEQLALLRGPEVVSSVARHDFVHEHQCNIDAAYQRLQELCGPKADGYVLMSLEWAEVSYKVEQARTRIRQHLRQYQFKQACTQKMHIHHGRASHDTI